MLHAIRSALGPVARVGKEITYLPTCPSTNDLLKAMAEAGAGEGTVLVAGEQTRGKGRLGRSFTSAAGKGVYLSALLRPQLPPERLLPLMGFTAEAMGRAVRRVAGAEAGIKWVNDVFCRGKKVCGILTEASLDLESGGLQYAIVGIGVNLYPPAGGFPEELADIMGSVYTEKPRGYECRSRLAGSILNHFFRFYQNIADKPFFEDYRKRSFLLGQEIEVLERGQVRRALALDLEPDFSLRVREADGTERVLSSGEVRARVKK